MPVNLSIKNAPDEVVDELRNRARRNHRSLQGELMAIIERAAKENAPVGRRLSIDEVGAEIRKLGLTSRNEAARMIREDRDSR